MHLSKLFDVTSMFYPMIYFQDDWTLTDDLRPGELDHFGLNSQLEKGKNKYIRFLLDEFYHPMRAMINSDFLAAELHPIIISQDSYRDLGRGLYFSYMHLYANTLLAINQQRAPEYIAKLSSDTGPHQLTGLLQSFLLEERNDCLEVKKNGSLAPRYDEFVREHERISRVAEIDFAGFLDSKAEGYRKFLNGTNSFTTFFRKEIDLRAFMNCFSYDKFCMCVVHSCLEAALKHEANSGKIAPSIAYVYKYIEAVETIKMRYNPKYKCDILIKGSGRAIETLTFSTLATKTRELLSRHPEFKIKTFSSPEELELVASKMLGKEGIDFSAKKARTDLEKMIAMLEEAEHIESTWTIIPKAKKGEGEKIAKQEREKIDLEKKVYNLSIDEKLRRMIIAKFFLFDSPYLYYLEGGREDEKNLPEEERDKFSGYEGFIFPSGRVVFYQFYKDKERTQVADPGWIYVMDYDKFVALTRLKKKQISEAMQMGESGVTRYKHVADMNRLLDRLGKEIYGNDYEEEVIAYMNALLAGKLVNRRGASK